jgi:hypothetical protein
MTTDGRTELLHGGDHPGRDPPDGDRERPVVAVVVLGPHGGHPGEPPRRAGDELGLEDVAEDDVGPVPAQPGRELAHRADEVARRGADRTKLDRHPAAL